MKAAISSRTATFLTGRHGLTHHKTVNLIVTGLRIIIIIIHETEM